MSHEKNAFASFNGRELLDFISNSSDIECAQDIESFINDIKAITTAVSNLYEERKMQLFMAGIIVNINVESIYGKVLEAAIGPNKEDVIETLGALLKCKGDNPLC